jgi:hypothetical protein
MIRKGSYMKTIAFLYMLASLSAFASEKIICKLALNEVATEVVGMNSEVILVNGQADLLETTKGFKATMSKEFDGLIIRVKSKEDGSSAFSLILNPEGTTDIHRKSPPINGKTVFLNGNCTVEIQEDCDK